MNKEKLQEILENYKKAEDPETTILNTKGVITILEAILEESECNILEP